MRDEAKVARLARPVKAVPCVEVATLGRRVKGEGMSPPSFSE